MPDSLTVPAAAAALILAVSCALLWRGTLRTRRLVNRLRQQVDRLERDRVTRPSLRVTFEFDAGAREALLHVTNDGGDATVFARLSVEGALAQRVDADLRGVWQGEEVSAVSIRRGNMRTLRMAELDLSVFPYAQWQIFARRGDEMLAVRAMNTSMIGGDPETHAPPLFLQVAIVASPDPSTPTPECTIVLQPFEAVRLRPV